MIFIYLLSFYQSIYLVSTSIFAFFVVHFFVKKLNISCVFTQIHNPDKKILDKHFYPPTKHAIHGRQRHIHCGFVSSKFLVFLVILYL